MAWLKDRFMKMNARKKKGSIKVDPKTGEVRPTSDGERAFAAGYVARAKDEAHVHKIKTGKRLPRAEYKASKGK